MGSRSETAIFVQPYLYCVLMLVCLQRKFACMCGLCVPRIKDLILMICSQHSIKRTETRGVKMVSTKTSRDVGMVPPIKQLHRKTTQRKKYRNKEGYTMTCQQPRSTFASFKARWIHTHVNTHKRPVSFSMQPLDSPTMHHPYISTGIGGNHFYSTCIYSNLYSLWYICIIYIHTRLCYNQFDACVSTCIPTNMLTGSVCIYNNVCVMNDVKVVYRHTYI